MTTVHGPLWYDGFGSTVMSTMQAIWNWMCVYVRSLATLLVDLRVYYKEAIRLAPPTFLEAHFDIGTAI